MKRAERIRDIVQTKRIAHVAHITPLENLPSIIEHGLLSRQELLDRGIEAHGTDPRRRDGVPEAICVTITRVQEHYLRMLRRRYPEDAWAILAIRPDVLWEDVCLFCDGNASSNRIIKTRRNLSSSDALKRMFDDYEASKVVDGALIRGSFRSLNETPPSVPTDPQAEVLVKGTIPTKYIDQICIEDVSDERWVEEVLQAHSLSAKVEVIVGSFGSLVYEDTTREH